LFQPDD